MNPIINFNVKAFLIAAEELVRADEVERALQLLDNLPAYYRDHEPREVTQLRGEILERIATPNFYKDCDKDFKLPDYTTVKETLRYQLVRKDVKTLNDRGITPHIIDYAPGTFFVPMLLKEENLKFTYQYTDLGVTAAQTVHPYLYDYLSHNRADNPTIFLALEVIEHLWCENEIKIEMLRANKKPCDIIHVSTPKYSYDYMCLNWKSRDTLGHLRAYTPREFYSTIEKIFPEYNDFTFFDSQILHVRGIWKKSTLEKYQIDLKEVA